MSSLSNSRQSISLREADTVLQQKGKSFYWARGLLKTEDADRATRLYSLCRYLDDWADKATGGNAFSITYSESGKLFSSSPSLFSNGVR